MTNEMALDVHRAEIGLDNLDAKREINRIADLVVHRTITTEDMKAQCTNVAETHYVTIDKVYKKVFAKVKKSPDLHPTHPAGKSKTYHELRVLAKQ